MRRSAGRLIGLGAGVLGTAAAVAALFKEAAEYQHRIDELQQDFTASQQEIRSLQAAYKLLLADAASKTKQSTAQQNAAAGLRACLIRAQCKQTQLQETLAVYGDYISAANERMQQLEEALVTALEESGAKSARIERLESEVQHLRAKADRQQASHSAQVQGLQQKHTGLVCEHERLVRRCRAAERDAAGAEAARDAKQEELALLQQQQHNMKVGLCGLADRLGSCSSSHSSIFSARCRTESDASDSSDSSRRHSSSRGNSRYGTSDDGSGSACCDCGECASCAGALSPRAAELQLLSDVSLMSDDEGSDSDSEEEEQEEDGSSLHPSREKGTPGLALDMGKLSAFNTFVDTYEQDPTAVSLVHILQSRGVGTISVPSLNAALQHITDSSCGFEVFNETAADVFVGACEAFAVEQPTGGDAAAALQAAAKAEAEASEIVRADGAAQWWGSEALRLAGAVVACGGPVLSAAEMQQLLSCVEQLGEKLGSVAELYHALPVLADILFA